MNDFDSDKATLLLDLEDARAALLAVVRRLTPDGLERARRGSWSISRILSHLLQSERLYTQLISVFSGERVSSVIGDPATLDAIAPSLETSRGALLAAVFQVRSEDFYRLQTIGHEEYSVLSILENVANHDREHAEQIRKTLASA